jgi:type I restriction enzyme M protein
VVLECVNRLLEIGYKPQDIILEDSWKLGHKGKGFLDISVKKEGQTFLMIECKTWGKEYDKELNNLHKDGGQLLSYFQQDKSAQYLVLYTSRFVTGKIEPKNDIIVIEQSYRETNNLKDLFERWNKFTKTSGIFDSWVKAYNFESKALTTNQLKPITQGDSSFIFHRFLEILRHNTVSDKPNAFNKIFTLFLCKIKDEDRLPYEELHFQWKEGEDNHIKFQTRLSDLYKSAMSEFLEKEITDLSDDDFESKFGTLKQEIKDQLKAEFIKLRLQKNNEFAIKDVFDQETFEENAIVLKEVVELLQPFKFRYNKKQPFLGDFFELLLTTGLKQEAGQFFTPVPIARFICKSIPIKEITIDKLKKGETNELLPNIIDYACGSGHFLTEGMEELQNIIFSLNSSDFNPKVAKTIESWKVNQFDWAFDHIYGTELDYRLVKTTKVGCYLHGDGIAKIMLADGLDSFNSKNYQGKLRLNEHKTENPKFDLVLSNPPYSVPSFKGNLKNKYATQVDLEADKKPFETYDVFTDQSSEIEVLFIERTKQLLKDGGIAAIILPASILTGEGAYTKAREILLKYFEFVSITELGASTFMATNTKTVILFLRRRNNYDWKNIQIYIDEFWENKKDIAINGIENLPSKYASEVWEDINFEDYQTLLSKNPNESVLNSEMYKEYSQNLKLNKKENLLDKIIQIEKEKMLYFTLSYPQKIVLVTTGEKNEEKKFLGYEFSNRRKKEGIHALGKSSIIDECTSLFDPEIIDNPKKASTYIYEAFNKNFNRDIDESLKNNIKRIELVNYLNFKYSLFLCDVDLKEKKHILFEKIWNTSNLIKLNEIADIDKGTSITSKQIEDGSIPVVAGGQSPAYYHNAYNRDGNIITISASGAYAGFVNYFPDPIFASDCNTVKSKKEEEISTKLIFEFLKSIQTEMYLLQKGQAQPHVYGKDIANIKIPNVSKSIQQKIIAEIEALEEKAKTTVISELQAEKDKILKKYL